MKCFSPAFWLFFIVLLAGASLQLHGQTPTPLPDTDNDVVKITTKLVQLDFLVVDKDGKQVTDLSADDVEILQDGKQQKITGFSFINTGGPSPQANPKQKTPIPPIKVAPGTGRLLTFIVDDGSCSATTSGVVAAREGLQKFLRDQMLPTDMVAIYRTRAGSSVFQQYTNDKARLLKIAEKINWRPPFGACSGDGSIFEAAKTNTVIKRTPGETTTQTIVSDVERKISERNEDLAKNNQIVGTLGLIRYVIQGLQRVPGRKIVFLMSDGIPVRSRSGEFLSATDVLRDVTDRANRASVVFNTIDSRGMFNEAMIEARDQIYVGDDADASGKISAGRSQDVFNSQEGLQFLALETGGRFYRNQNYLDVPVRQALSRETGYYLAAYEPSEQTFKGKNFNKIIVKTKRPDLKVLSRAGFYGVVTEIAAPKRRTADSELFEAIVSPLPVPGLTVNLSAYFGNTPIGGNFVRTFFHLDGTELKFTDDQSGNKKAVIDVVAVTMNEKNEVVDEFNKTFTIKFVPAAMDVINQYGLICATDVPIKKPGTYNFRVAVRDAANQLIGSAGQVVDIPNLKNNDLFVSGLTLSGVDASGKFQRPAEVSPDQAFSITGSSAVPAIRRFQPGTIIAYAYTVYNARLDKITAQPQLSVKVNLYKDGKLLLDGPEQAAELQKHTEWSRIEDFGYMRLNQNLEPGDYALQVTIVDKLAGGKKATYSQSIDFEIGK